ncbi:MAG: hypothetical protein COA66_09890 [Arcobacter sp.]|nr:MAG: hypothetical protein COA66_09890 [Arcobacter sp.]
MELIFDIFKVLASDLTNERWQVFAIMIGLSLIPFFISFLAKQTFYRLIFVVLGYNLLTFWTHQSIIKDLNVMIGIALIAPHLKYFFGSTKEFIFTAILFFINLCRELKYATTNAYYFFITIYYKILRLIHFIKNIVLNIKIFFQNIKNRESKTNDSYKEKEHFNSTKDEYTKEENFKSEKFSYNENSSIKNTEAKAPTKYEQFYDSSYYIVLGVSTNDSFSDMKKSYRVLINIYHPDLNPEETELFTEISQNINNAYEYMKKNHKK